ncbi:low quality protein: nuclear, partial [Lynx pardinus]
PTAEERSPASPGPETGPSAEPGSTVTASPRRTSPPPTLSASAGETHSPTIQRARYPP